MMKVGKEGREDPPQEIQSVLLEFKDVMPPELPKK